MDAFYRRWALRIAELNGDADGQWEIYLYALRFWVSTVITFILLLTVGWVFDCISLIIAATCGISLFRAFAGGAHQHKAEVCSIMTMLIMSVITILSLLTVSTVTVTAIFVITVAFAYWSVYRFAPADTPNKPIVGEERAYFRRLSFIVLTVLVVGFGCLFVLGFTRVVLAGTLGMLWQAFSMTPHGYALAHAVDGAVANVLTASK
ncbi:hypothetical protein GTO91_05260 [Heliobacterium undosum]|uniref:Accessory gene regulator B n=1 Tax=Heliomicrobium undosum TaxID=121734 RepID=A0A845L871_9FIRM|nr:accessory gene regulator B family protein [Heliomicrobium undosum]MZP29121.1 hypothetical protein [Heliomicrobium undosum]